MVTEFKNKYRLQITDHRTGQALTEDGGNVLITKGGEVKKADLYDPITGDPMDNPFTPTRGLIQFVIDRDGAESVVDIYAMDASGHTANMQSVLASGPNNLYVDTFNRHQVLVVPYHHVDAAAAGAPNDTKFVLPDRCAVLPNVLANNGGADAGITLSFGTLTDADGFLAAGVLDNIGAVKGTLDFNAPTLGALLQVLTGAAGAEGPVPEMDITSGTDNVVWSLSNGADTALGIFLVDYYLAS